MEERQGRKRNFKTYSPPEVANRAPNNTKVSSWLPLGTKVQPLFSVTGFEKEEFVLVVGQWNPARRISPKRKSTAKAVGNANASEVKAGRMIATTTQRRISMTASMIPIKGFPQEQKIPHRLRRWLKNSWCHSELSCWLWRYFQSR